MSAVHYNNRFRAAISALLLFLPVVQTARALNVDLDAYVQLPILQEDGVTPMADGSWVFIIGSTDSNIDPMASFGVSNYIADSVTGDDVILGVVRLPLNTTNSGTFFTTVLYESDEINYAYLRFFSTTSDTLTGLLWWGTSSVFELGVTLGVATVQFDQDNQLIATNRDTFVVVPEPKVFNYLIVWAGMLAAMRSSMKRAQRREKTADAPRKPEPVLIMNTYDRF